MYYDPVVITLALSHEFADQLVRDTEQARLVQNVHTIIPSTLLQLATIVSTKVTGDGWLPASSNPPVAESKRLS